MLKFNKGSFNDWNKRKPWLYNHIILNEAEDQLANAEGSETAGYNSQSDFDKMKELCDCFDNSSCECAKCL